MRQPLKQILRFSSDICPIRPHWPKLLLSFGIELLVAANSLLPPLILKCLFDYAYPTKDTGLMILLLAIPFGMSMLVTILKVSKSSTDLYVNQQVFERLYTHFYSKVQRLPLSFFNKNKVGDLMYRLTDDVSSVVNMVLIFIPKLIVTSLKIAVLLVICMSMDLSITVLACAGLPFIFYQTHSLAKKLKRVRSDHQKVSSRVYHLLEERLSQIKLVKCFHRGSSELKQFLKQVTHLFIIERKSKLTSALYQASMTMTNKSWTLMVMIVTGFSIIKGQLSIGEVVAISTYVAMLQVPIKEGLELYRKLITSEVSCQRILEILDHEEEYTETDMKGPSRDIIGDITFESVTFGYQKEKPIFKDMSFEIEAGKSVAIIGKSGIGKSSIMDLILRFYDVNEGQIRIDGEVIENWNIATLRSQIGLISPDHGLLDGSVRDNITFGVDGDIDLEAVYQAAEYADAHTFIKQLPKGYDTQVGPRGSLLSSGQRQRIALARTFLKDPSILILDEATNALDSESQTHIQKMLANVHGKKTIIYIAHQLSSIKYVDQVIVLGEKGAILEQGDVLTLMNRKGYFYKCHELQFGGVSQFFQQVQFYLKNARRYQRNLSLGCLSLTNYETLVSPKSQKEKDQIMDEWVMCIGLFLREVDFFSYDKQGQFYIAFPETDEAGTKVALLRLEEHMRTSDWIHIEHEVCHWQTSLTGCHGHHTIEELTSTLNEKIKELEPAC